MEIDLANARIDALQQYLAEELGRIWTAWPGCRGGKFDFAGHESWTKKMLAEMKSIDASVVHRGSL